MTAQFTSSFNPNVFSTPMTAPMVTASPEVVYSGKHNGTCIYFSRILGYGAGIPWFDTRLHYFRVPEFLGLILDSIILGCRNSLALYQTHFYIFEDFLLNVLLKKLGCEEEAECIFSVYPRSPRSPLSTLPTTFPAVLSLNRNIWDGSLAVEKVVSVGTQTIHIVGGGARILLFYHSVEPLFSVTVVVLSLSAGKHR